MTDPAVVTTAIGALALGIAAGTVLGGALARGNEPPAALERPRGLREGTLAKSFFDQRARARRERVEHEIVTGRYDTAVRDRATRLGWIRRPNLQRVGMLQASDFDALKPHETDTVTETARRARENPEAHEP